MTGNRECHPEMYDTLLNERDVLARIRLEMEKHLLQHQAPEDVNEFLIQHWAKLMTGIFMAKGNQDADWNAGWDAVNALLWSLSPKFGRVETEKMLRLLPSILSRLQEGCNALGLSSPERDPFFERLAMLHAAIARAGLKYRESRADNEIHVGEAVDTEASADISGLPPSDGVAEASSVASPSKDPSHLKPGDRVCFIHEDETRCLILNWVSPVGGMYMFANEQGLDALTLTRARLLERFRSGTARSA